MAEHDEEHQDLEPTLLALGKLSKALETTERARGRLYDFHQLTGEADYQIGVAAKLLREAGHEVLAERVEQVMVGRNVLPGRWTFQIVDEYDGDYYPTFVNLEREVREELGGARHQYEATLKRQNVTSGEPGHELTP